MPFGKPARPRHGARREIAHRLCVIATLGACLGCGGGGGTPAAPVEDTPTPLEVNAGTGLGAVTLTHHARDPSDLMGERCELDAWLAHAAASSDLGALDAEGACLLLPTEPGPGGFTPPLTPACAGAFRIAYGSAARTVAFCDRADFPAASTVDCADAAAAPSLSASSLAGELPGDELASLDLTAARPSPPTITEPARQGVGMSVWPDGELSVAWQGEAASSVEIILRARPSLGRELHCFVPDDGQFTLPERLVADFRATPASLEVLRATVVEENVDGFDMRVSSRVGDAMWLAPRAAP